MRRIAMPADAPRWRSSDAWCVHWGPVTEQVVDLLEALDGRAQAGRDGHGKRPFQRSTGESRRPRLAALLAVDTQTREGKYRQSDVTASVTTKGFGPRHARE